MPSSILESRPNMSGKDKKMKEGSNMGAPKSRTQLQETWRRLLRNKGAIIGMVFLAVLVLSAILSGFIFDYDTQVIQQNIKERLQWPSHQHFFGTDELGRDIFIRILYGARYSLAIGCGSVAIGLVIGVILGSLAGFYGGVCDQVIMRANDILYAIPNIMIAVVIVSLLGTSTFNLLLALCVSASTSFVRITRAAVMTIRGQEYIESAYAMGLPTWKVILKHVIPNSLSPIIVQVTLLIGTTIISASSLSFLGIGVPSPAPEWGAMLSSGRSQIRNASYICVIPGLAIMFTVLALNLLGDGLRDALDPKLKK
jgi:peptide/nickel transport system permease protein